MTPETPEIPGLQTGEWSWKENCIQQRQGKKGGRGEYWKGEGMAFPVEYSYWKRMDFMSNLIFFSNIYFLISK